MKLRIIGIAHHRNGVCGAPFDVALFEDQGRETGRKVAILFAEPHHCAVLDVPKLTAGDIAFGSNSWRGDQYEPTLRRLLPSNCDEPVSVKTLAATNEARAERCDRVLAEYGDPTSLSENLIDLLTDAMHWCNAGRLDFHFSLAMACRHYVNELNDEQHDERRMP
jgi:hypothetical protein